MNRCSVVTQVHVGETKANARVVLGAKVDGLDVNILSIQKSKELCLKQVECQRLIDRNQITRWLPSVVLI